MSAAAIERASADGLRPYQRDAVGAVEHELSSHRSTLLVMPTGTGKTVVFATVAERFRRRGRILVLVHRDELATQAQATIERTTGLTTAIEMGDRTTDALFPPDVVIASVQTLAQPARRARFAPDAFALVIIDEAHHAAAKTYRDVVAYFGPARVLGVTATPDRHDGSALGEVFESVAFVYEIRDAIEQGFLVPIKQRLVTVESLDLAAVRTGRGRDFNEAQLAAVLMAEDVMHRIAVPTLELAGDRPTIVFAASVAHARALAEVLNRYRAGAAVSVDGTTEPDVRRDTIAAYRAGRVQFLVNCALLTEGFDAPHTACISMARPTQSRSLYAQMLGRGTRLSPDTGKRDMLALDFVGNAQEHKLVTCADILDGREDECVRARARQLLAEEPDLAVHLALDRAAADMAAEARRAVTARARYQTIEIDPFALLGADARPGRWGGLPATLAQLAALQRKGVPTNGIDRGQASALLGGLNARRLRDLCTYKQAAKLASFGLNPDVSFVDATRALDAIAGNRWRAPAWLYEDPVFALAANDPEVA